MTDQDHRGSELAVGRIATSTPAPTPAPFVWKDFSRFVEVHPVQRGWLVLWGRYEEAGRRKVLAGNRTYRDLAGVAVRSAAAGASGAGPPALPAHPDAPAAALALFARFPSPAPARPDLPGPC